MVFHANQKLCKNYVSKITLKRKKIYEQIVMSDPKPIVIYPGGLAVYKYSSMHGKDDLPNQFERRISNSMRFFWKKNPTGLFIFFSTHPFVCQHCC